MLYVYVIISTPLPDYYVTLFSSTCLCVYEYG